MATWREVRLFCKRHQLAMFCMYVAGIYIILNVFVAESNVSLMRFKKTDGSDLDDFLNEDEGVNLKERGVVAMSGERSDKRNNLKDLRFMKGFEKDAGGDLLAVHDGDADDDDVEWKEEKEGDFVDEFYQGSREEEEKERAMNANADVNNLPKNKFHEERVDDVNEEEVKRDMLRGKLERLKKLDDIIKEEKREFGAYWEKVNKDKEKKDEDSKKRDENGDDIDDENDKNDENDDVGVDGNDGGVNKVEFEENEIENDDNVDEIDNEHGENSKDNEDNREAAEMNENENRNSDGDGVNFDENEKDGRQNSRNLGNKSREEKRISGEDSVISNKNSDGGVVKKERHRNKDSGDNDNDGNDDKNVLGMDGDDNDADDNKNVLGMDGDDNDDDNNDADDEGKVNEKDSLLETVNPVLDIVMAQLEKDKLDTFEMDLSALNKTMEDIKMPYFVEYGKEGDPGQNSTKYNLPPMPKEMDDKRADDYTKNYFDLWVSNKIAVHRSLNDPRTEGCRTRQYNITTYPTTSIIIVFHNEAWTTLLRSIHSIIDRTPASALLEIILLDDSSTDEHLKQPLEVYVKTLDIVRLVRATARLGLIKARNLGFLYSKGDIIIFLDSHIECFEGWLDPLVGPIVLDPKTVTFPIIDVINKDDFGIEILPSNNIGTLSFAAMSFTWERSDQTGLWYYRSPTMPGGLYAISRKWFHHLGAYDPGLKLWGVENLEISFKIWMCGGTLLASACSHVGHVFRTKSPNKNAELSKAIRTNAFRLAEVWLDSYKHLYYEKINYKVADYGDVTNQKALRKSLQCKSFDWYLSKINPKLKEHIGAKGNYSGLITNRGTGMCLQADLRLITVRKCDMMHMGQTWQLSSKGFLTNHDYDLYVMEFASRHKNTNKTTTLYTVKIRPSSTANREDKALFSYNQKTMHLVHKDSQQCLDLEPSGSRSIRMSPCHPKAPIQKWELMTRDELQDYHRKKRNVPIDWSV